ncbi:MAG: MerR family transcriptional regulator [Chloroflexota bacterium]
MFKIGDFSKLSQVSSKALRYYDDIGLLKPKHVDRFTGYRYYSVDQLPRLNRIIALKELGFSLEQVTRLLKDDISAEQIQGMLRMKEAEIERHIEAEQQRLRRVQARLQQIIREDAYTAYDIIRRQVESVQIASIREHIPDYSHVGQLFGALFACLEGKSISGVPFVVYHDGEYRDQDVDVEAAIVVDAVAEDTERVRFSTFPAVIVAATIHTGAYETLSSAYGALLQWIESNGYDIRTPNREFYLRGPGLNRSLEDYVTEIQFPIVKRTIQEQ